MITAIVIVIVAPTMVVIILHLRSLTRRVETLEAANRTAHGPNPRLRKDTTALRRVLDDFAKGPS